MEKHEVLKIARHIRSFLLEEFPKNQNLENQCKRASILLDMYFKKKNVESYPTAGYITVNGDTNDYNRGHVWNIIYINGARYLLDITLTQFSSYLQKEVPDIVLLPYQEALHLYSYKPDGRGKYEYQYDDVRFSLVMKVDNLA